MKYYSYLIIWALFAIQNVWSGPGISGGTASYIHSTEGFSLKFPLEWQGREENNGFIVSNRNLVPQDKASSVHVETLNFITNPSGSDNQNLGLLQNYIKGEYPGQAFNPVEVNTMSGFMAQVNATQSFHYLLWKGKVIRIESESRKEADGDKGVALIIGSLNLDEMFMAAIEAGDESLFQRTLALGADVNAQRQDKMTPLLIALRAGRESMAITLMSEGAEIHAVNGFSETALMLASEKGYVSIVNQLILNGADKNLRSENEETALQYAIKAKQYKVVGLLVKNGVDSNDRYNQNVLINSFRGCYGLHNNKFVWPEADLITSLIEFESNKNLAFSYIHEVMKCSYNFRDIDILPFLNAAIKNQLHTFVDSEHGALIQAIYHYREKRRGHRRGGKLSKYIFDLTRYLIEEGALLQWKKEDQSWSFLSNLSKFELDNDTKMFETLLKIAVDYGGDINDPHFRPLGALLSSNNLSIKQLKLYLDNGATLDFLEPSDPYSFLVRENNCIRSDFNNLINFLDRNNARLNSSLKNSTAIKNAVASKHCHQALPLLFKNDLGKVKENDNDVLIVTSFIENFDSEKIEESKKYLELFLKNGYRLSNNNKSPITTAIKKEGGLELAKVLVDAGAEPSGSIDRAENNSLYEAIDSRHSRFVNFLVNNNAQAKIEEIIPYCVARLFDCNEFLPYLKKIGNPIDSKIRYKVYGDRKEESYTALTLTIRRLKFYKKPNERETLYNTVKVLLDLGAGIKVDNITSRNKNSFLLDAISSRDERLAKLLLESGADPNYKISKPLWWVLPWNLLSDNTLSFYDLLIQYGAELDSKISSSSEDFFLKFVSYVSYRNDLERIEVATKHIEYLVFKKDFLKLSKMNSMAFWRKYDDIMAKYPYGLSEIDVKFLQKIHDWGVGKVSSPKDTNELIDIIIKRKEGFNRNYNWPEMLLPAFSKVSSNDIDKLSNHLPFDSDNFVKSWETLSQYMRLWEKRDKKVLNKMMSLYFSKEGKHQLKYEDVKLLLDLGASPDREKNGFWEPSFLHNAILRKADDVFFLLIERGAKTYPSKGASFELYRALERRDESRDRIINKLLSMTDKLDEHDSELLLEKAVRGFSPQVIKHVLDKGSIGKNYLTEMLSTLIYLTLNHFDDAEGTSVQANDLLYIVELMLKKGISFESQIKEIRLDLGYSGTNSYEPIYLSIPYILNYFKSFEKELSEDIFEFQLKTLELFLNAGLDVNRQFNGVYSTYGKPEENLSLHLLSSQSYFFEKFWKTKLKENETEKIIVSNRRKEQMSHYMEALLGAGAEPNKKVKFHKRESSVLIQTGLAKAPWLVEVLIDAGANFEQIDYIKHFSSNLVRYGSYSQVEKGIEGGMPINFRYPEDMPYNLLDRFVGKKNSVFNVDENENELILDLLFNRGLNPNLHSKMYETDKEAPSVIYQMVNGNTYASLLWRLIDNGFDVNYQPDGESWLRRWVRGDFEEMTSYIYRYIALDLVSSDQFNPHKRDSYGDTFLSSCFSVKSYKENTELIKKVFEKNVDVNLLNLKRQSPMMKLLLVAKETNKYEASNQTLENDFKKLKVLGADMKAVDIDGNSIKDYVSKLRFNRDRAELQRVLESWLN